MYTNEYSNLIADAVLKRGKGGECARQQQALAGIDWNNTDSKILNNREVIADVMKAFGPLPVSEVQLGRLKQFSHQVLPVKYYTCPLGWNEYSQPNAAEIKRTGVAWMTERGTWCAADGDETTLVDSYLPVKKVDDYRALNEEIINLMSAMVLQLPEGDELKKKQKEINDSRAKAKEVRDKVRTQHGEAKTKNAIKTLMPVMKTMPEFKFMSDADLKLAATQYLADANICLTDAACSNTTKCVKQEDIPGTFNTGVCVLKDVQDYADRSLDPFADSETQQTAAKLTRWWRNYAVTQNQEGVARKHQLYNMLSPQGSGAAITPPRRRMPPVQYEPGDEPDDDSASDESSY